ncbi:MAG: HDIG domain-containing protein [Candidatus Kapaibacteriales bacterium]
MAKRDTLFDKIAQKEEDSDYLFDFNVRNNVILKFIMIFLTVLVMSVFFAYHIDDSNYDFKQYSYTPGYVWNSDPIIADFDFAIKIPAEEYEAMVEDATEDAEPVFRFERSASLQSDQLLNSSTKVSVVLSDTSFYSNDATERLDSINYTELLKELTDLRKKLSDFVEDVYDSGMINIPLSDLESIYAIAESQEGNRAVLKKSELYDREKYTNALRLFIIKNVKSNYSLLANEIGERLFIPNLKFSDQLTQQRLDELANSVPHTKGIVKKGDVIIYEGQSVTKDDLDKLHSYQNIRFINSDRVFSITNYLGSFGHAGIILSIFLIYLFILRKRIFFNNFYIGLICSAFIIVGLMAWLTVEIHSSFPIEYLIFLPSVSMLAAIILDSRTAFYLTVSLSLLIAGIRGNDYIMGLVMLVAGSLAAYTVRDIQNRTQMYQSIFSIFVSFIILTSVFALEWSETWTDWLMKLGVGLLNSISSPLVTFGILYLLDRFSPITTDLKLEEYDDLDHPLLERMNELAPGTYQHSLGVASLAERCAVAIGANALYCRVTSLFHDIGKMERPEYYVENQIDMPNKHEKLSPKKSAHIIIDHVRLGIEMAHQYKLPENIIDIIKMHHGTTTVQHFYAKEIEEKGFENVSIEDFSYPGPIPNTKEAVIIMICDAAEAMSRIGNKDRNELSSMVEKIILDRISEKQLINSKITTHELHQIKDTIVKNLIATSHKRVQYKQVDPTLKSVTDN